MSIFPATDLVSDVARAADPQRLNAAVTRLADLSSKKVRPEEFADLVRGQAAPNASATPDVLRAAPASVRVSTAPGKIANVRANEVTEKFEAYILQTFLQTMLPQSDQALFGRGAAGGVWRSMLAEQLGDQIARAGGVGLQKMLDRAFASRAGAEPADIADVRRSNRVAG